MVKIWLTLWLRVLCQLCLSWFNESNLQDSECSDVYCVVCLFKAVSEEGGKELNGCENSLSFSSVEIGLGTSCAFDISPLNLMFSKHPFIVFAK